MLDYNKQKISTNINKLDENQLWGFGLRTNTLKKTILWGGLSGILISLLLFPYKIVFYSNDIPVDIIRYVQLRRDNPLFFFFIVIIFAPFLEEVIFRGFVYRFLRKRYNIYWGYFGSTALFTIAHGFRSSIILSVIMSLILTHTYEKTKLLGTSVIAHSLGNLTWCIAIYAS